MQWSPGRVPRPVNFSSLCGKSEVPKTQSPFPTPSFACHVSFSRYSKDYGVCDESNALGIDTIFKVKEERDTD